jgi:uncharacterized protein (DUF1919 family)
MKFMQTSTWKDGLARRILSYRTHNRDFSIISSNCWGSQIYLDLRLPYRTPFVGLFLNAPCYLRLIQNLVDFLEAELEFTNISRYPHLNDYRAEKGLYPLGVLHKEVEIHFLHYKTEAEAYEKWNIRKQRVNFNNLFYSFTDRDLCTYEHLVGFNKLPYHSKVCFTAKPYPELDSTVWLKEYSGQPEVGDIFTNHYICKRHFDTADWLNGGSGQISQQISALNRLLEIKPDSR